MGVTVSKTGRRNSQNNDQGVIVVEAEMTLFEDYKIRRVYDEDTETWWFSVIDIVQVLTQ